MNTYRKIGKGDTLYKSFQYRGWDVELYRLEPQTGRKRHGRGSGGERWSVNGIFQGDRELPGGDYGGAQPSLDLAIVDAKRAIDAWIPHSNVFQFPRQRPPHSSYENPLSSGVVLAVAAVGGLAAAIYYATRPAAPATSARGLYGAPGTAELGTIGAPVWNGALGTWCYYDRNGALVCHEDIPKPKHLGV